MNKLFSRFAQCTAYQSGRSHTFVLALLVIILWAITGPLFNFSDTWQLVINTGTTIITFLMVFLIQNTQSRDTAAIQAKLDELILVNKSASNKLIAIEQLSDEEMAMITRHYHTARRKLASTTD